MGRESANSYFTQKTNALLWLVGVVGLGMVYAGWFGDSRSVLFMIVGAALALLCAYELIRSSLHKRKGTELDAVAQELMSGRTLLSRALERLCLSSGEVGDAEKIALSGYCAFPIRTRPYFRRDEEDGRLRSSNYQNSMLILCDDRFYTYTRVLSLVDKENTESGRMWGSEDLTEARVVRRELSYLVGTSDNKRESADIEYLLLRDREGREYTFFFDGETEGADKAARVVELLEGRVSELGSLPVENVENTDSVAAALPPETWDSQSAARGRDLEIGEIGGKIKKPKR